MSQMQPSYRLIAAAAATTFLAMFVGAGVLTLHCQLLKVEVTGFERTVCEGPVEPIGLLLIILTPVGTSVAGLLSREHGLSGWPFYVFATALAFES